MKNFIISLTLFISSLSYSAIENPSNIYGYWLNNESEILLIQLDNSFTRSNKFSVLAQGNVEFIDDKILVYRTDTNEEYALEYFLGKETLVVMKPNSQEAWLFSRIGDLLIIIENILFNYSFCFNFYKIIFAYKISLN